jgi:hypothetical protein
MATYHGVEGDGRVEGERRLGGGRLAIGRSF